LQEGAREILVGTRASELALAQAKSAVKQLAAARPDRTFRIRTITTAGDRFAEEAIPSIGAGVFTKEIERNLLNRTLDIAVHSLKDLPTAQPEGLAMAAVLEREDPRDALVSRDETKLADLPRGGRIGTGSIRRAAQLKAFRADFEIVSMRGNVPTRLAKLESLDLDAIVLAVAGLKRLEREDTITEILEPDIMLPAAAQGIVAIEARARDADIIDIVRAVEHDTTRIEALAERQLLDLLGGGCYAPIGTLARIENGHIGLNAVVCAPDGTRAFRAQAEGDSAQWRDVTWKVAQELIGSGAQEILRQVRGGRS
jgi:hydroxymethylbilane synthase